jgi:hypothetical protein
MAPHLRALFRGKGTGVWPAHVVENAPPRCTALPRADDEDGSGLHAPAPAPGTSAPRLRHRPKGRSVAIESGFRLSHARAWQAQPAAKTATAGGTSADPGPPTPAGPSSMDTPAVDITSTDGVGQRRRRRYFCFALSARKVHQRRRQLPGRGDTLVCTTGGLQPLGRSSGCLAFGAPVYRLPPSPSSSRSTAHNSKLCSTFPRQSSRGAMRPPSSAVCARNQPRLTRCRGRSNRCVENRTTHNSGIPPPRRHRPSP